MVRSAAKKPVNSTNLFRKLRRSLWISWNYLKRNSLRLPFNFCWETRAQLLSGAAKTIFLLAMLVSGKIHVMLSALKCIKRERNLQNDKNVGRYGTQDGIHFHVHSVSNEHPEMSVTDRSFNSKNRNVDAWPLLRSSWMGGYCTSVKIISLHFIHTKREHCQQPWLFVKCGASHILILRTSVENNCDNDDSITGDNIPVYNLISCEGTQNKYFFESKNVLI